MLSASHSGCKTTGFPSFSSKSGTGCQPLCALVPFAFGPQRPWSLGLRGVRKDILFTIGWQSPRYLSL